MTTFDQILIHLAQHPTNVAQLALLVGQPPSNLAPALQMLMVRNLIQEDSDHCPSNPQIQTGRSVCGGCSVKGFCASRQDQAAITTPQPIYRLLPGGQARVAHLEKTSSSLKGTTSSD